MCDICINFHYLVDPCGVLSNFAPERNWMQETNKQHRLSEMVTVERETQICVTLNTSFSSTDETRVDVTSLSSGKWFACCCDLDWASWLSLPIAMAPEVVFWTKIKHKNAVKRETKHSKARETNVSFTPVDETWQVHLVDWVALFLTDFTGESTFFAGLGTLRMLEMLTGDEKYRGKVTFCMWRCEWCLVYPTSILAEAKFKM